MICPLCNTQFTQAAGHVARCHLERLEGETEFEQRGITPLTDLECFWAVVYRVDPSLRKAADVTGVKK